MTTTSLLRLSPSEKAAYDDNGFHVAKGLFSPDEVNTLRDHFMQMHAEGGGGFAEGGVDLSDPNPLRRYPRLMQMHRGDQRSMDYMLDTRLQQILTDLLDLEPFAVQTMMYFKPAGAKGQALHQDNRYLRVQPGTCMAAWLALDDTDEENGCLRVVRGSHKLDMLCLKYADLGQSFTWDTVDVPEGLEVVSLEMKAGDVLFFNGSVIHGSGPNVSKDRFRRILVGHYITGDAERVAHWYFPIYRFDGSRVQLLENEHGGPCGEYVRDGEELKFQITGRIEDAVAPH
jgi:hypothetical protein